MSHSDLTNKVFGRWKVISLFGKDSNSNYKWNCLCECGNKRIVSTSALNSNRSKSCGCLLRETMSKVKKTHGMSGSPTYGSWRSMIKRCNDPNNISYKYYGGAGITVCERWNEFINFYEDMGERPEGKTLDRIAGAKVYSKETCKWSSLSEQAYNKKMSSSLNVTGVRFKDGKYEACITKNGKYYHLGRFDELDDAKRARLIAEEKHYPNVIRRP